MTAYAAPQEYRNHPLVNKSSAEDDYFIGRTLEAVSRMLDRKLNEPYGFHKDTVATTRVYESGQTIVPIASTAGLVVKASGGWPVVWAEIDPLTINEDFELLPQSPLPDHPYTGLYLGPWPYTEWPPLVLDPTTYRATNYRVQVTAIHGWPAVPAAIKDATIILAATLIGESIYTTGRINELDNVVETSPQARMILKSLYQTYNRYPVAVG